MNAINPEQAKQMTEGKGFIAALDQSGGSTPKALGLYGVTEDQWNTEDEMFDLVHEMRARIIKSPSFNSDHIIGAILFEQTMDRDIDGIPTAQYLWENKGVVPFLKTDKGLAEAANGVQLMKPCPELDELLERAVAKGIFGTKMRSFIAEANEEGIKANVEQQFEFAKQVLSHGLIPIVEPEVDIHAADKAAAEAILRDELIKQLDALPDDQKVMIKVSIPSEDGFYTPLVEHPKCMRVVALSGGYPRDEANERLSRQPGMIASFSRALSESLTAQQSDAEFDAAMAEAVKGIYEASL